MVSSIHNGRQKNLPKVSNIQRLLDLDPSGKEKMKCKIERKNKREEK